jgi:hypothetical protein
MLGNWELMKQCKNSISQVNAVHIDRIAYCFKLLKKENKGICRLRNWIKGKY